MAERGQDAEGGPSRLFVGLGVLAGLVVLGVLLTVGLGAGGSSDEGAERPAERAAVTVEKGARAFSPAEVRVPVGGVGVFGNDDSVEHTFTADGGLFDSGPVAPGSSFSFNFSGAGELTYHCEIHPSMKGRVVVEAEG